MSKKRKIEMVKKNIGKKVSTKKLLSKKQPVSQTPVITVPDVLEGFTAPKIEKKIEPPIKPTSKIEEKKIIEKKAAEVVSDDNIDLLEDKNKVEALLFASGRYIDDDTISELCSLDKRRLKKILEKLKKDYESKNSALMIFNEGNSWKINVREKYLSIVRKIVAETELPRSVMETLAVIAWKSPILQSEVVNIRGNKCYDHIDLLEETGFVTKEKKGRSYVLKTTDKFFNYFEIDEGNIKGLFDTVKVPEIKEEQKTLDSNPDLIKEDVQNKVAAIDVKKWTETEEEKQEHKQFLENIEGKIKEAQEKNKVLEEEIPRPTLNQPASVTENMPEQQTLMNNSEQSGQETQDQKTVDQPTQSPISDQLAKPKTLTKKQLERKFKEELMKVREKMENKK